MFSSQRESDGIMEIIEDNTHRQKLKVRNEVASQNSRSQNIHNCYGTTQAIITENEKNNSCYVSF